ncbi:MAG: PQQ-dependent sugar dehydrogenase [Bacteroidetes bacterium]|nr:PQQ-dependent sugar dehydrogenase [Bacteroidota bacterium]
MQAPALILLAMLLACRSGQSPAGEGLTHSAQDSGMPASDAAAEGKPADGGTFPEPELEIIATGLDVPWGMDLLPNGQLLVAERNGRITRIDPSTGKQTELARRPALNQGEGGLLGMVLDPEFAGGGGGGAFPYLYLYETTPEGNRIVRMRLEGDVLSEDQVLLTGIPKARYHNGGVIRFGPDGYLYAGTGDGRDPFSAQDPNSLGGKVLRMTRDGAAVEGISLVYSLGHRNIQGLAWDAEGNLYATEHGPSGEINGWCCHDEVNRIVQGGNYGWPHVIGDQTREGCLLPLAHSGEATWAPGGCAVLRGSGWGPLEGHLITAGLRGQHLQLFDLKTGKTSAIWFQNSLGRLRNVLLGPDGSVYFCSSNRDGRGRSQDGDDKIYRVKP